MKTMLRMLALGLTLGAAALPAAGDAQPRHDRYERHDNGNHYGWRNDRRYRNHGRRVCRWERHHGRRIQRCFYR